jgi:hypothetical protein
MSALGVLVVHRARVTSASIQSGRTALRSGALASYARQVGEAQDDVFAAIQAAAAGPPSKAAGTLISKSYSLRAHAVSLDVAGSFGNAATGVGDLSFELGDALQNLSASARRAAALRTKRAQLRTLLRAPGLVRFHTGLVELERHLRRADIDDALFDQRRWRLVLRARALP